MLQRQSYDVDPRELTGEERVEFVRWNVLAAMRELGEALNQVNGWKPWQTERDEAGKLKDRDEFVEELVDVLHFLGNLLLVASVSDDELDEIWKRKQFVNAKRQELGYEGVGKEFDADHPEVRRLRG